jgi:hypothetical protein
LAAPITVPVRGRLLVVMDQLSKKAPARMSPAPTPLVRWTDQLSPVSRRRVQPAGQDPRRWSFSGAPSARLKPRGAPENAAARRLRLAMMDVLRLNRGSRQLRQLPVPAGQQPQETGIPRTAIPTLGGAAQRLPVGACSTPSPRRSPVGRVTALWRPSRRVQAPTPHSSSSARSLARCSSTAAS